MVRRLRERFESYWFVWKWFVIFTIPTFIYLFVKNGTPPTFGELLLCWLIAPIGAFILIEYCAFRLSRGPADSYMQHVENELVRLIKRNVRLPNSPPTPLTALVAVFIVSSLLIMLLLAQQK